MAALNLACGIYYVSDSDWINVDWEANSSAVLQMDLSKPLTFESETFDFIYTSHFIEHITYLQAERLLTECYRLLSPGGAIRIITPDFEKICREYLRQIDLGILQKSEYLKFTLIDQMIRNKPGGESGTWRALSLKDNDLRGFISHWSGTPVGQGVIETLTESNITSLWIRAEKVLKNPRRLKSYLMWKYFKMISLLFPKWFRRQHISFCRPGERHLYLFDFNSLKTLMEKIGFSEITRSAANSSITGRSDIFRLDLDSDEKPRKGAESMYVEARKIVNFHSRI